MIGNEYFMHTEEEIFEILKINRNEAGLVKTLANKVFLIGDKVLKIYDSGREKECKNAIIMYRLMAKNNVSCPKIFSSGDNYILMEKLEGDILEEGDEIFYKNFGRLVGRLHKIQFDKFGGLDTVTSVGPHFETENGPYTNWKDMHLDLIKFRTSHLTETPFSHLIQDIIRFFEKVEFPPFIPTLIHEDLNKKNILVSENQVSGVIDPDGGYSGCTEEELMRVEKAHFGDGKENLRTAFLEGYQEHSKLMDGYEKRRAIFSLSRELVHAECIVTFPDYRDENSTKESIERISLLLKNNVNG